MTTNHTALLAFIIERRAATGQREMQAALGISSTSVVRCALLRLERCGELRSAGEGSARAWVPVCERRSYGEINESR